MFGRRKRLTLRWRGMLRRRRGAGRSRADADPAALADLRAFALSRVGVEGLVEPRTTVTPPTLVLVARDGEWTRRQVPDAAAAHTLCNDLGIPSYDAAKVGYPARMRAWSARNRQPR